MVLKLVAEEISHPTLSVLREEKNKMVVSEPMPQVAEAKISSQPEDLYTQPIPILPKAPSETQSKSPETTSKTEPAASQQSSPSALERTSMVLKPNFDESTFLASSSQEVKENMAVAVSMTVLQETEPMKSPLKIIPKSPETTSQQGKLSKYYKAILGDEERSKVLKVPLETQGKQSKEKEKMMHHQPIKAGKAKDTSTGQPFRRNSLMFHDSVTERDPGVQVTLPQKPEEPIKSDDKLPRQTHKTKFNISRAEKLTYQPMVRRRCLRGLFVEPSDSLKG
ncbi:unnamed protein product [Lupinus luteus]|uniref:Uncharacterized protein n=1 Tax=Lupinus luteus TaxID=3873 RepID=A0AAV1XMX9_LUPLU